MPKELSNFAFIDGQNFYTSLTEIEKSLEQLEVTLDLDELRIHLKEKHGVKTALYFIGYVPKFWRLYERLKASGYELEYKEIAVHDGEIKGNVDVNLTLHSLIRLEEYEKAVIMTSDGDYACLVEYLADHNKLECLIACSRDGSSHLLRKLHYKIKIFYLDDIIRDLYKRKETS